MVRVESRASTSSNYFFQSSSIHRIERDTFGELYVPVDRYWGAQTQRSTFCNQAEFVLTLFLGLYRILTLEGPQNDSLFP